MQSFEIKESNFFKDYTLDDQTLGNGITGDVQLCTDKQMRKYAVKMLPDCAVCRNEVYIQWSCGAHENVVDVVDVYSNYLEEDETATLFIVMELMGKGDLWNKMFHEKITENEAKEMMRQIVRGLKYLHSHEISHRDLKPENILLTKNQYGKTVLKLGDFGYAEEKNQTMTEALYTFYYGAPEVLTNDPKFNDSVLTYGPKPYDKRCDLYSLGVIAYTMLMGYPPFLLDGAREMNKELYDSIMFGNVFYYRSDWETIPSEAKDFVFSLLSVNPDNRPTARELLDHPWIAPKEYLPDITFD
eukprot:TRINITY_DN28401_c0_g1_i1.p1 TRINITY_DN28401_c0_g1~~TRINITY_DN28401_c0_g1_i1.p1  ORF type:complete len:300 (-),score=55.00 TRINITY_DN28401_c0_g1_i1:193-1092(-)